MIWGNFGDIACDISFPLKTTEFMWQISHIKHCQWLFLEKCGFNFGKQCFNQLTNLHKKVILVCLQKQ